AISKRPWKLCMRAFALLARGDTNTSLPGDWKFLLCSLLRLAGGKLDRKLTPTFRKASRCLRKSTIHGETAVQKVIWHDAPLLRANLKQRANMLTTSLQIYKRQGQICWQPATKVNWPIPCGGWEIWQRPCRYIKRRLWPIKILVIAAPLLTNWNVSHSSRSC